jgi:hypothetical protein
MHPLFAYKIDGLSLRCQIGYIFLLLTHVDISSLLEPNWWCDLQKLYFPWHLPFCSCCCVGSLHYRYSIHANEIPRLCFYDASCCCVVSLHYISLFSPLLPLIWMLHSWSSLICSSFLTWFPHAGAQETGVRRGEVAQHHQAICWPVLTPMPPALAASSLNWHK